MEWAHRRKDEDEKERMGIWQGRERGVKQNGNTGRKKERIKRQWGYSKEGREEEMIG